MSIFRRESESPAEPKLPPRPAASEPRPSMKTKSSPSESTHIATGSKVVGRISGSANLVIDGVVEGEIDLESQVVVGSDGRVEGKILAQSVEVGGRVMGNVHGFERVEVLATGSLEGDVMSPRVVIAEGAFFKGKVEMTDKMARPAADKGSPKHDGKPGGSHGHQQGQSGKNQPGKHQQHGKNPPNKPARGGGAQPVGNARR